MTAIRPPRLVRALVVVGVVAIAGSAVVAQVPPPILDMHMHARTASHYGPPPQVICAPASRIPHWDPATPLQATLDDAPCEHPLSSPLEDEQVLSETIAAMDRYNVIGVLGGPPDLVARWMEAAPGRFIPGLDFRLDRATGTASAGDESASFQPLSLEELRGLFERGTVSVLAEVLNQYGGIAPGDPRMDKYWALAEELDVPVGIHVGPGAPGEYHLGNRGYRARLQSALTLEDVLVRFPRLRVYVMHAGYPFLDDLLALLFAHPHVYVEVSMLANVEPRAGSTATSRPS